jgi:WS/DGAT/MGAT family acyltransferase
MLEQRDLILDAGARWGAATMSDMEALMWRCESSPRLRSGGVLLEMLDRLPEWESFLATHEWAVSAIPRLRDRVLDDPLLVAAPEWVADDGFDLAYHLRRTRLPTGGGVEDLIAIAQVMAMSPFDRVRPLWEAVLVDGLPEGRAAYLLKLHHSLLDGAALIQLFDILHPDHPNPAPDPPAAARAPRRHPVPPPSLLEKRLGVLAGATRAGTKAALGLSGQLIRRPEPTIEAGVRFVQSLARVAGPPPASPSPLMTERGISRRLRMLDVPLDWMRAAGKGAGGSVNDVFLAALTGALRLYHEQAGAIPKELPIGFPVSLRREDDPLGGNRFSGARIAAPVGTADPAERIRLIREQVLEARDEPALDFVSRLSPVLARIPARVVTGMTERVTRSIDLQASNFPGLTRPAYLAGARVTRMYPFGPAPGAAAMVTMLSHEGICCVGITADAAAISDVDWFAACVRAGFDEVLALAGHSLKDATDDPGDLADADGS